MKLGTQIHLHDISHKFYHKGQRLKVKVINDKKKMKITIFSLLSENEVKGQGD